MPVELIGPGVAVSAQVVAPLGCDGVAVGFAERLEGAMRLEIDYGVRV